MKKVLYYAMNEHDATSLYRIAGVLPFLPKTEYELINGCEIKDFSWAVFTDVSVFILQRPCFESHFNLIKLAQSFGVKVIVDYDDNLLAVDVNNPTFVQYRDNKFNMIACLKAADEVWVSTESLGQVYGKYNKTVTVIPNAHNDYLFPIANKRSFNEKTKRVLWRGGQSHEADVYEVADELVNIVNANKDWEFQFWGQRFIYMELRCGNNYVVEPMTELSNYFENLLIYNPNIVIFPLCDTEFNAGKSNIAWLEGTYAGAAVFANGKLPEFNKPGIADMEHLSDQLQSGDNSDIKEANENAWQYILDNLLLSKINLLRHERILAKL